MPEAMLSAAQLEDLLAKEFPEGFNHNSGLSILKVWHGGCLMRRDFKPGSLRPGGTISGPVLMAFADVAMYVAVLASIGWQPLSVTTNLAINFLKKPEPGPLEAECRLLKLGKRLAVGDVSIRQPGVAAALVAHATSTYSIPPRD